MSTEHFGRADVTVLNMFDARSEEAERCVLGEKGCADGSGKTDAVGRSRAVGMFSYFAGAADRQGFKVGLKHNNLELIFSLAITLA